MDTERQNKAADRVIDLAIAATEVVQLLRRGQSDNNAYALLYVLRRELGYVVRDMGRSGNPTLTSQEWAEDQINRVILRHKMKRD